MVVDAGWRTSADVSFKQRPDRLFTAIRRAMPDVATINRLIITHEDRDHCGGAQPFISEWCGSGRSIEECWLPAIWSPLASAELRRSRHRSTIVEGAFHIAPEILEIAKKIAAEQSGYSSVKLMDRSDWDGLVRQAARAVATEQGTFDKIFADAVEIQDGRQDRQTIELETGGPYPIPPTPPYSDRFRIPQIWGEHRIADFAEWLVDGAIDTHYHISQIVGACLANHVPIRWFDFGLFERNRVARGGDAGFLTPVNAVEVIPLPARISAVDFFLALSLSKANRECLMFLRHQQDSEPAVLFSGDSRLTTLGRSFPAPAAGMPTTNTMAVTAMHHASDHNQAGYPILASWLGQTPDPIFIRNGGHGVKRAASGFLTAKQRLCVGCIPMTPGQPQIIRLRSVGADWVMPSNAPQCTCT